MKKFILLLAGAMLLASCENYAPVYKAALNGNADGKVDVSFPDGNFAIDGAANLDFAYGNKSANFYAKQSLSVSEAAASKNKDVRNAAKFAQETTDEIVASAEAGGHYYLEIDLYFMEPATGTEIHTHKVLTNKELK